MESQNDAFPSGRSANGNSKTERAIKLKEIKERYDRLGWLKREDILWLLEELEKHHAAND